MEEEDDDMNEPIQPSPLEMKGGPEVFTAYKGKVVAIADGEIRASGNDWGECVDAVRKLGIAVESVILFGVPRAAFVG